VIDSSDVFVGYGRVRLGGVLCDFGSVHGDWRVE
jgi:hypothetical protein